PDFVASCLAVAIVPGRAVVGGLARLTSPSIGCMDVDVGWDIAKHLRVTRVTDLVVAPCREHDECATERYEDAERVRHIDLDWTGRFQAGNPRQDEHTTAGSHKFADGPKKLREARRGSPRQAVPSIRGCCLLRNNLLVQGE